MIGVDYDLFWTLNPKSLSPFIKAFKLKQEYEDRMNWMLGAYIKSAIAACFSKTAKYPVKPFTKDTGEVPTQEVIKARFLSQIGMINSLFRKEE